MAEGTPIKGYRVLSAEELRLINEAKELAERVGEMVRSLAQTPGVDGRWLAIAATDLQKGFMSLTRSIAKPETF